MSKVAVVTGGTRGIGAAIAQALKEKGLRVIATFNGKTANAQQFHNTTGITVEQWDVGDFKACTEKLNLIETTHGPIAVLVNNAGITQDGFLHKMESQQWQNVIHTNLTACFNTTRCVIERMRQRGYGRIINITSVNGQKGQLGQTNYAAAKAGVIGFTKALALESAAKGITVNAVAPGYIDTDMMTSLSPETLGAIVDQIPTKRLGLAQEVARAVVFLADEAAGYITGATLNVNGGLYMM